MQDKLESIFIEERRSILSNRVKETEPRMKKQRKENLIQELETRFILDFDINVLRKHKIQKKKQINTSLEEDLKIKVSTVEVKASPNRKNTGIIVTVTDAPMPVVVYVQALSLPELPLKYLLSPQPKVWQTGDKLFYEKDCILAAKGSSYSPRKLEEILQHIRLAGDHLAEVNKKVNNKKPNLPTVTFKDGKVQRRSAMSC